MARKILTTVSALLFVCVIIPALAIAIWLMSWKTYRDTSLGFSFRYPPSWHVITILPATEKQIAYTGASLIVDPLDKLPWRGMELQRSPGDVQITIEDSSVTMDIHRQLNKSVKKVSYGKYIGYTSEDSGGLCRKPENAVEQLTTKNDCVLKTYLVGKSFDLKAGNYYYYVNSYSRTDNMSFLSLTVTRFWGWVGTKIVDSFVFDK